MNPFLISSAPQGSDEWKAARAGKATGSNAKHILAKIKSGEAAARRDYRVRLVMERITNAPEADGYVSPEMRHGTEQEPFARMAYERKTGRIVQESGFVYLPNLAAGCSVDGFVDDGDKFGIIEIKCPKTATHLAYCLARVAPPEHMPQILHNLWITGARFCDFISFDPRVFPALQLFIKRVWRDDAAVDAYAAQVLEFLDECDAEERQYRALIDELLAEETALIK